MPKKRNSKKGRKTHVKMTEEEYAKIPKTLVFRRGKVGTTVQQLIKDMRKVMLPFTAPNLKERRHGALKDYLHVSGQLGVTHFLMFSCTDTATYFKVGKTPGGPTLVFKVDSYSLSADVKALQARPHSSDLEFRTPPLVVLNGFAGKNQKHLELVRVVFRELFPKLNVDQVRLEACRRVVLIDYNEEEDKFEWRHYIISVSDVGIHKNVKKILKRQLPDLGKYEDISDFILSDLGGTESDAEDESTHFANDIHKPGGRFSKPKKIKKQSKITLHEVGPRMSLTLSKIQEKLLNGDIHYQRSATSTTTKDETSFDENDGEQTTHEEEADYDDFSHGEASSEGGDENSGNTEGHNPNEFNTDEHSADEHNIDDNAGEQNTDDESEKQEEMVQEKRLKRKNQKESVVAPKKRKVAKK